MKIKKPLLIVLGEPNSIFIEISVEFEINEEYNWPQFNINKPFPDVKEINEDISDSICKKIEIGFCFLYQLLFIFN